MEWPTRRPSPHLRGHCWHGLPSTRPLRSDSQLAVGWMKGDMKSMADQVESKVTTNMQQTIGKHDGKMQQLPPSRAWRVFPWALQNGSSRMWASFFATLFHWGRRRAQFDHPFHIVSRSGVLVAR